MTFTKELLLDSSDTGMKHVHKLSGEHFRTKSVLPYLQYVLGDTQFAQTAQTFFFIMWRYILINHILFNAYKKWDTVYFLEVPAANISISI